MKLMKIKQDTHTILLGNCNIKEDNDALLFADESTTDTLINELMAANAREKDPAKVLEDMERERREMEERFTIKAGEAEKLREQEVLSEYGR